MNRKILLVDDDPAVRRMLLRVLDGEQYEVQPARTGAEALQFAAGETFRLVLLDINLPGEDGWGICQQFMNLHPDLPILVITARSNQLFPALASGVGALMEKPLDMARLLRTISELLEAKAEDHLAGASERTPGFHYVPGKLHSGF
jgi:two-component system phosphate regulon response regulator OmpR